jgi:hypothetical protein
MVDRASSPAEGKRNLTEYSLGLSSTRGVGPGALSSFCQGVVHALVSSRYRQVRSLCVYWRGV